MVGVVSILMDMAAPTRSPLSPAPSPPSSVSSTPHAARSAGRPVFLEHRAHRGGDSAPCAPVASGNGEVSMCRAAELVTANAGWPTISATLESIAPTLPAVM